MNINIKSLIKACVELDVEYEIHHDTKNIVSVLIGERQYYFLNWVTPLNPHSVSEFCKDKDYFYTVAKDVINMPKTASYLSPFCEEKYKKYLQLDSIESIVDIIPFHFDYPLVIKRNKGSHGNNVYKVCSREELIASVLSVFNINSCDYDYICLAQEYIEIEREFRAVFFNGQCQFAYLKDTSFIQRFENLSPFHNEGAKAVLLNNDDKHALDSFCKPLFKAITIPYCGLDIAEDVDGKLWLIEANSSPGFDYFIKDVGDHEVVRLYKTIITTIGNRGRRGVV